MQNEERINVLETQVRTLKRIVYGFGCLLVAGVVVSATSLQTVPDVIQAKKFEVVNDEGKVFAAIGASKYGGALGILNKEGKQVSLIAAYPNGGQLSLSNKDGKQVAAMFANEHGGALVASNKDGKQVAAINVTANGDGQMLTKNKKGRVTSRSP